MQKFGCCSVERNSLRVRWRKLKRKIWDKLFGDIPNNHESKIIEKAGHGETLYVAMFVEDAFDIGIGFPDKWLVILSRKSLRKLIFWYIWRWVWGEWFGLRRWLFYKILHLRVERCKKFGKTN